MAFCVLAPRTEIDFFFYPSPHLLPVFLGIFAVFPRQQRANNPTTPQPVPSCLDTFISRKAPLPLVLRTAKRVFEDPKQRESLPLACFLHSLYYLCIVIMTNTSKKVDLFNGMLNATQTNKVLKLNVVRQLTAKISAAEFQRFERTLDLSKHIAQTHEAFENVYKSYKLKCKDEGMKPMIKAKFIETLYPFKRSFYSKLNRAGNIDKVTFNKFIEATKKCENPVYSLEALLLWVSKLDQHKGEAIPNKEGLQDLKDDASEEREETTKKETTHTIALNGVAVRITEGKVYTTSSQGEIETALSEFKTLIDAHFERMASRHAEGETQREAKAKAKRNAQRRKPEIVEEI